MPKASRPRRVKGGWQIRWFDENHKRVSKTFQRYDDADRYLRQQKVLVERIKAGLEASAPEPHTFGELCDHWIKHQMPRKRSPKDHKSIIEAHLRPFFGEMELTRLGVKQIDKYVTRCHELPEKGRRKQKGLSDKTVHNHLTLLKTLLRKAKALKWIHEVPTFKMPELAETDYRWLKTEKDIQALLKAAGDEREGVRELYTTAIYTGMRAGELLGLRWEDVDFEMRLIKVRRSYDKPTKSKKPRPVPILNPLLPVLEDWRRRNPLEYVFPGRTGRRQGPSARVLQEIFHRCLEGAKLENPEQRITFHDLRHTFASHWVMKGGDLYRLQKILGHASPKMTARYAHLAPEAFKDDWGRLDAPPSDEKDEETKSDGEE
jgi:integrase